MKTLNFIGCVLAILWAAKFYQENKGSSVSDIPFGFLLFVLTWLYALCSLLIVVRRKDKNY
jgi:hypothetical protein